MSKPPEFMSEVVNDPKHAFRQAGDRPAKSQKHRYERRKIREIMKTSDWEADPGTT